MICIWEPVEQHVLPQLDFHQNSKSQSKVLGNMSTFKVLAVKDSLFGQLIGAHLWFDNAPVTILSTVLYMASNLSKRG